MRLRINNLIEKNMKINIIKFKTKLDTNLGPQNLLGQAQTSSRKFNGPWAQILQ